ncbi:CapA family protein [Tepidiforma sp.]|uniref:CapA family protein n=1 Tax=Tepidiforma sp. TaxID=2682230 RepID=UPI002ADD9737|nr:CapA family protein [Tepidiforma sp.]
MGEPAGPARSRPWLPLFAVALGVFLGSLAVLAIVIVGALADTTPRAAAPGPTPTPAPAPLACAGEVPPAAEPLCPARAAPGAPADLAFEAARPGEGVVTAIFVPVTSPGAGVDALSADQFAAILRGEVVSWAEVGGFDRPIELATLLEPPDLAAALAALDPALDPARFRRFASLDELRAALALDSGLLAIIPIEQLRSPMVALAIDGRDPARGFGDLAGWPLARRVAVRPLTPAGSEAAPRIEAAIAAAPPVVTRVVATGDILMSRCTLAAIRATGDWASPLRSPVGDFLAAADIAAGSLDGSIQDIAEPYGCIPTTNLTSPPQVIEALTHAGFDVLTVATNHAFDCADGGCGARAMLRTIELLAAAGIRTVGGGPNLAAALEPAIIEVNGVRFGFLGFDDIAAEDLGAEEDAPGTAPLDDSYDDERSTPPREPAFYKPASMLSLTRFEAAIRDLRARADVVIVLVQSGYEDTHEPSPRSLKALRAAVDAGADLVVGNQAHWVQAIEPRGDAFIACALGNFIFDQLHTPEHTEGYLLEATFHGSRLATLRFLPYRIEQQYRPVFADAELRRKVLADILSVSPPP